MSFDNYIDQLFEPVSKFTSAIVFYSVPIGGGQELKLILLWLALAAAFFTIYLGFVNIRYFSHSVKLLFGKGMKKTDGEISQFQALMASLSGTVGLGNISGVAVAISVGGPGAAFWMTVMGFLGMSSKFAEVMLGVKYRAHPTPEHPEKISGGPMYYIKAAFVKKNAPKIGIAIAYIFAFVCILGAIGGGNMYQANQVYAQLLTTTGGEGSFFSDKRWIVGIVLAILVGVVIFGGLKSIASVASRLVPAMIAVYVVSGLIVALLNVTEIPAAIVTILSKAFSLEAGIGGLLGGLLIGVQRAAFSNEAGLGSAAIVQSTTNTDGPVGTGIVAMLGPFIDTVIICNITALVIVISGAYIDGAGIQGVELTSRAFENSIPYFSYILSVCVFLFAYSTMIAWYYNGAICVRYIFGEKDKIESIFKVFYCICTVVGTCATLGNLIDFTDAVFLALALPNIIGLYLLAPEIKADLKAYITEQKK